MLAATLQFSPVTWSMSAAIVALLAIALWTARNEIAKAHGIDKIVALTPVCFAVALAAFGAEHFAGVSFMLRLVPPYMPWRVFWVYFVGVALIAAALSIATQIQVRWSGLLLGIMMFLFVAMLYLPSAIKSGARLTWTIASRESAFGGGGWVLAGIAMGGNRNAGGKVVMNVGRVLIGIAAIFFGVEHFLHPLGLPGVPLQKEMPLWIPARPVIDYLTGAFLVAAGICFLLARRSRTAAAYLGAWIVLLIAVIYVPVMIGALQDPKPAVQLEGLNYFADTLLFGGVILSLALTREVTRLPHN